MGAPETFTHAQPPSCPTTPMSQRRRLRINQSPKPPAEVEARPKYREGTEGPFKPGFYRPPPEETTSSNPIFKLIRRNNSKTNLANKEAESPTNPAIRISAASSKAYEADRSRRQASNPSQDKLHQDLTRLTKLLLNQTCD